MNEAAEGRHKVSELEVRAAASSMPGIAHNESLFLALVLLSSCSYRCCCPVCTVQAKVGSAETDLDKRQRELQDARKALDVMGHQLRYCYHPALSLSDLNPL